MSPLVEMLRSSRIQLSAWLMLLIIPIATSAQEHSTRNKGMASVEFYARSYFYASMKVSIEDLAPYAFASEGEADDYKTKAGLILDFGYGKQLNIVLHGFKIQLQIQTYVELRAFYSP